jgi:hypothetical protein
MARSGQRDKALAVLPQADDRVTMAYIEHQISRGDLKGAHRSVDQLKAAGLRSRGLCKLALAK